MNKIIDSDYSPLNPLKGRFTHKQLTINLVTIAPLRGLGVTDTTL